jgi:predicted kinase
MRPTLYLMFGYPGAGKTTAAEIIHKLTGAVHLSSDKARFDMFSQPNFDQREHDELYKALDQKTEQLLKDGQSVIYDANLNRLKHRQDKYDIGSQTGAKVVLLWVQTPKDIAKERASHLSRQHLWPPNETSSKLFDRIAGLIEEPGANEPYVAIDGTKLDIEHIREELKAADEV